MTALIREGRYEESMKNRVEPALAVLRETIEMPLRDGGTLHAEIYPKADAKRAVVIVHGYTESAEKFREVVWYFLQSGFSVFSYDHRGHGRSVRAVEDESITHVDRFSDYVDDLEEFMENVVRERTRGMEKCLYAHSMGGAVGAFYLMRHPDEFARAVLNAPMIAPSSAPYPVWVGVGISKLMRLLGRGKKRAFVGKPFDAEREKFETSCGTGRARFEYYKKKRVANRCLQNCSPSYAWVCEGFGVTKELLKPENCQKIKTPILLCQATRDTIVRLDAQDEFVSLVPGAKKEVFDAKHEIYGSADDILGDYYDKVIGFLSE